MLNFPSREVMSAFLDPRSIAVVGASADPTKTSGMPVSFLLKHGYGGKIFPINPRVSDIGGLTCYPDAASLPEAPDVGMVLVGAERCVQAVADLARIGTKAAVVLSSGFAEAGEDGRKRQNDMMAAAGSMRILGPNTIGIVNVRNKITLSATGALAGAGFRPGSVSVISQSGGILGSFLSRAAGRGIGLSKLISTSNEADLDVADFLDHLADDPETQVLALYLETVRNPEKFRHAVEKARSNGKHIVALKVGRSEAGARAAVSHTGAMAGSDQVYDAFFERYGVIRAQSYSDLLDIPLALSTQPVLRGRRIAILTSTGGAGTLVSDSLGLAGFDTPPPDAETIDRIREALPISNIAIEGNPIDVTLAGLQGDALTGTIKALARSQTYDGLAIIVGSSGVARPELIANAIQAAGPDLTKPLFAYVSPHAPDAAARLAALGVPAFSEPERLASSYLALMAGDHAIQSSVEALAAPSVQLPAGLSGSLDEAQAKGIFAAFGIKPVREIMVTSGKEAEAAALAIGGKVVLKILSGEITHKSDIGGVAIGCDAETIAARLDSMKHDVQQASGLDVSRYLVQQMVSGIEVILGLRKDPLGSCIMLGMGGVTAELLKDTTLTLLPPSSPLTQIEAIAMIDRLKMAPLLKGYRGRPMADVAALARAIVDFSRMVQQLGSQLVEAEINPIFVLPEGQGIRAADGVMVLA